MAAFSASGCEAVTLDDGWQLACAVAGTASSPDDLPASLDWIHAPVPGTAAQALRDAGRYTAEQPLPLHDKDIWYRTRFEGRGPRSLIFGGLATLAEVWLNGRSILVSDNMFLAHEIDVDLAGDNELIIAFRSLDAELARRKGRARWRTALVENNALRQVRTTLLGHMTGWQPPVHAVGPWRAVEMREQTGPLRVTAADVRATLDGNDGLIQVTLDVDCRGSRPQARFEVAGISASLEWTGEGRLEGRMRLAGVEKWWPHTHGTPFLYRVRAVLGDVELEADQFLARVQSHPSLAVLCGASEVAQQAAMLGLPAALWSSPLYDDILPGIAKARCPDVPLVAQSPEGGDLPFQTDAGVSHYYGVGAYLRPLDDVRRADVRFASECLAFANMPAGPSSPSDIVPRDRGASWDFSEVRDHYLERLYGVDATHLQAQDPVQYRRLSRALSADLMEAVIGEWRRPASACAGALVWMLKDLSPGAGWGVIDSSGIPKLAIHGLRRAFRPVQVALTDEGLNGLGVHLINETALPLRAKLSLICLQAGDVVVMRRECEVVLPARSARTMTSGELIGSFFDITYAYRFGEPPLEVTVVTLTDAATGTHLAEAAHFPLGRSAITHDPGLSATLEREGANWSAVIQATKFAPCIQFEVPHYYAADEGFHLLPGEQRRVKLLPIGTTIEPPTGEVLSVSPQRNQTAGVRFG